MKSFLRLIPILFLLSSNVVSCYSLKGNKANGQIIYQTLINGKYDLNIINNDGSNRHELIKSDHTIFSTENKFNPVPSPDGEKIAFVTDKNSKFQICVFNKITGTVQILTDGGNNDYFPTWSPDGKNIGFISDRGSIELDKIRGIKTNDIYIMDENGKNITRVTDDNSQYSFGKIDWSPDGSNFAVSLSTYLNNGNTISGISLLNIFTKKITKLTADEFMIDGNPKWAPDGDRVLFTRSGSGFSNIFIINVDGTNLKSLTNDTEYFNIDPFWSPDGKFIAYSSNRENEYHIYLMNPDGSNKKRLSNVSILEVSPIWISKN